MESFFSDDRDIVISTHGDWPSNIRGATWRGTFILLFIAISVVAISVMGGVFADMRGRSFDQISNDFLFCRGLELIFGVWIFSVGASVGSFLNVVAWRSPQGLSVNGHSLCPNCKTRISAIDNIPLVGWLRLRGRCFTCHSPIPFKYPLYEGTAGYMFLGLYALEFLSHGRNLPEGFVATSRYGLTTNLHLLTSEICWLFALHLVFLSGALACLMTRMEGGVLPVKYLLVWVAGATSIVFLYPQVGNSSLDWLQMQHFKSTASFFIRFVIVSGIAFLSWSIIRVFRRLSERISFKKQDVISTHATQAASVGHNKTGLITEKQTAIGSYRSTLWIVASVMATVALGIVPGLAVMTFSYLLELVAKFSNRRLSLRVERFSFWEVWVVPTTLVVVVNWRTIDQWLS